MDRQQEHVIRSVSEQGIRFIRLWFTDIVGQLKSVAITAAELESAFEEGIGFDGSAIEGLARVSESDMIARPDASTFQILPLPSGAGDSARMFADIFTPAGEPAFVDPRNVLRRSLQRAGQMGLTFYTHPEIEFYLFHPTHHRGGPLEPLDDAGYFDHVPGGVDHDFRRTVITLLESMGIAVEFSHHEAGPGQNEIDLRYADALTTADNILTFRAIVKEATLERGFRVSFMPKPLMHHPGSGMHTHLSLFEGDTNVFHRANAQYGLSTTGRYFLAGLLHHAAEITAVGCQFVNSYKRLWGGSEAPSYICWGHHNRSALVRVPRYKPGKGSSARLEYRGLDSATNPYLAFAVLLRAGLSGIENKLELPPEAEDDVWNLTDEERRALTIHPLPGSLDQALHILEHSELIADTLGERVLERFLANKRREWQEYRSQITPFEIEHTNRI